MPDLLEGEVGELRLEREDESRGGLARRVGDDVQLDGDLVLIGGRLQPPFCRR